MKEHLNMAVEAVDAIFGEGYAKKNPELIGRLIQGEMVGFGLFQISEAVHWLADTEDEYVM